LRAQSDGVKLRGIVLRRMQKMQGLLACALLAASLAGCELGGIATHEPAGEPTSASAAAAEHRKAAEALEQAARKAEPGERDGLLWRAAEEWFAGGDTRRALRNLEAASALPGTGASPTLLVLAARAELERGVPQRALDRVMKVARPMPPALMAEALDVEGRARFALGDGGGAVAALVAREHWLQSSQAVRANEQAIWEGLQRPGLSLKPPAEADATTRGWLELAGIAAGRDVVAARPALLAWRERYPKHPANGSLLPTWLAEAKSSGRAPQRVALVLPLSGRLGGAGAAVRDGFLTAYFGADPAAGARPEVLVFDTQQLGPEGAYDAAVRAGSEFVVGPLSKTDVTRIAATQRDVPVLALNTLAEGERGRAGFYQFALAPEEEAEQTAARARADGHTKALALVSNDDLGKRLLDSFTRAFEEGGGRVLAYEAYDASANDHQAEIMRLLALDVAQARHHALVGILGEQVQFEPRPRQDADFIFLGAQAAQARLLRPELRFHFAGDLPVYATSSVYEPHPTANEDLDGIVFADMPCIVAPATDDPLRVALRELGSGDWQRRGRLYALGYDAYNLVPVIYGGRGERVRLAGETGILTVEPDGHVRRELRFAQLHNGVPRVLPESAAVVDELGSTARP
jgi:outer membrane PBP1 activator LpoA protein